MCSYVPTVVNKRKMKSTFRSVFLFPILMLSTAIFAQRYNPDSAGPPLPEPGSAYVEQYIPQDTWHGYCLPVDTSLTFPFTSLYMDMRWYDEPNHKWWRVTNTSGDSLLAAQMRGYMLCSRSELTPNSTVGVKGRLKTGYQPVTVTSTLSPEGEEGLNFIGNPYPSAVNWYMVGLIDVDPTLYVFSSAWNNYVFWNRFVNVHSSICRFIIPAMQGFFVHCSAPAPGTGQVVMTNACRLHDNGQIYKDNPDYDNFMTLTAYGNGYRDESFIWMSDSATMGFDGNYDALRIEGDDTAPQLYSIIDGGDIAALNTRPWNWPFPKVELGFRTGVTGVDTLVFDGLESFPDTVTIWLEDKKESHYQILTEDPQYIFTAAPGDDPARFTVWFYNPWTTVRSHQPPPFRIWSFEDRVFVDLTRSASQRVDESPGNLQPLSLCHPVPLSLTLFDLAGRMAFTGQVTDGVLNILQPGLTEGYYIARLERDGGVCVQKLFIK
jgi:hypothetical protein